MDYVFIPNFPSVTSITVSGSTLSAALAPESKQMRLYWNGGAAAQVRWGKGAQTAVTTDMQLSPGSVENFGKQDADTIAVIGTGTLYIVCGAGE